MGDFAKRQSQILQQSILEVKFSIILFRFICSLQQTFDDFAKITVNDSFSKSKHRRKIYRKQFYLSYLFIDSKDKSQNSHFDQSQILGQKRSHRPRTEAQLLRQRNLTSTTTLRPSHRAMTSLCLKLLPLSHLLYR